MADSERERIAELVRRSPANHEYFFDNLDDPAWLPVLVDQGFFRKPAGPERGDGWIRFPFWSESRYLVRVAARAPQEVFAIAMGIPPTENVRVHEDMLKIAAELPAGMAAKLARKEIGWLGDYDGHLMSLPGAAADALAHLAREGELVTALELARAVLAISRAEEPTSARRQAVARIEEYSYARIIERAWPSLVEAHAGRAFTFLCDRLADVVRLGFTDPSDRNDSTSVWRPAIEDHGQNVGHSLLDLLVDAVREHALEIAQTPEDFELVLTELEKRSWPLFERIALDLIRERGPSEAVASKLHDRALAFATEPWHEYGELLRDRYADLDGEEQKRVVEILNAGEGHELTPAQEKRGVTAADLDRWDRYARLKRLVLIAEHLEGDARAAYEELRSEFGVPEHPTFLHYVSSWTGPTSPFSAEELGEMSASQVAQALREWVPAGGSEDPSPEGLGRILQELVAERAAAFADAASEFVGLDASYVRSLLAGLSTAAQKSTPFPWAPVLDLGEWVAERPRSAGDDGDDRQGDPHWGWARKELASLLSRGLGEGDAELPFESRERVWSLLAVLAEDPDPTPEHEDRYGGDNMDPATLSINTTRGEAMHAVVRYALWVERALEREGRFEGSEAIPEVVALLDRHVDVGIDPSTAVRSVYGQWFPQFVRIDDAWARRLAPRIFPPDSQQATLFAAAWNAYVVFNRPYTDVFPVLRDAYATAVKRLESPTEGSSLAGDPRKRLGDHLLTFEIRGEMEPSTNLFRAFWEMAPPELRQEVLTTAGWSIEGAEHLEPDIRDRLVSTWEWIVEVADASEAASLAGFGGFLATRALDGGWLLKQAIAVLARGVYLEPDFIVYGALPRLAHEHPRLVAEVLHRMIETDPEDWSLHGSTDEVRETLSVVLDTGDADTSRRAITLIDLLGARGMTAFRDLMPPESP